MQQAHKTTNDPNKAIQEMMDTIDSLRGIYIRENEALDATDAQAFMDIQQKKLEAANEYQAKIESILSRGDEIKTANPLLKNRLVAMQKDFSVLAEKNLEALTRMQRCTERLGGLIMDAAREAAKSQRNFVYGETGAIEGGDDKRVSMGVSETA